MPRSRDLPNLGIGPTVPVAPAFEFRKIDHVSYTSDETTKDRKTWQDEEAGF